MAQAFVGHESLTPCLQASRGRGGTLINRNMLTGMLIGIGIAVGGGVAAFTFMNQSSIDDVQTGAQADVAAEAPVVAAAEECWEEEVEVPEGRKNPIRSAEYTIRHMEESSEW